MNTVDSAIAEVIELDEQDKFIQDNIGKDGLLMGKDGIEVVTMHFDYPEVKGTVALRRSGSGAEIWVNGKCIGLLDLFHLSDVSEETGENPYFQIAVDDPFGIGENVAFLKFKEAKIEFLSEWPFASEKPLWVCKDE
jgi:hypothetical protein